MQVGPGAFTSKILFCTTVCIFGRISDGRFVFCVPPPFSKSIFCATVCIFGRNEAPARIFCTTVEISHPDCTPL